MSWKTRSAVAVTTTAVLTAGGFALVANGSAASPAPSLTASATTSVDTTDLERSLDDLMAQVSDLETAVAENDLASTEPAAQVGVTEVPSAAPSRTSGVASSGTAAVASAPRVGAHDDDHANGGRAEHEDDDRGYEIEDD